MLLYHITTLPSHYQSVNLSPQSKREFKIWDEKNTSKPVSTYELDQAAGVMIPFYDEDTRMLYLTGKVRKGPISV